MWEIFLKKLTSGTKLCYAIGNLGYGTISQTLSTFIMFFGTSVLGIKGTLVGLGIAIAAFWDGLSDPIMGYISDTYSSKIFGRRLGYLLLGTIGMAIFNILLWSVPVGFGQVTKFFWLLVMLVVLETSNTLFATPYVALGIDLAPGYNEQSSLQAYKTVFLILGMVLPSVFMMVFMPSDSQGQLAQNGYMYISYVSSALAVICGLVCIFGTKNAVKKLPRYNLRKKEKNAFFKIFYNFFVTLKRKNYGAIIMSYSVALVAAAFLTSVGMHLFTYSFHFGATQIPLLMTVLFVGAIASQPVWIFISRRIDKKPALNVAYVLILVGIALTAIVFVAREQLGVLASFWLCMFCMLFCGFGTGALYSLPLSMFADNVTLDKLKTGENNSATYSGYMTFAYNISNSIALLVIGVLLDIIKFDASMPVQALKVQNGLGVIVFVGCGLSILGAMFLLSKYTLKRADILKQQIKHRNQQKNKQR